MTPQIDGYEMVRQLGHGGMSTVWLAIQTSFPRQVALKIMSDNLASSPTFVERFLREARIVANLEHRGIVHVYDMGKTPDATYLTMEHLPGGDLSRRLAAGEVSPEEGVEIIREIASALAYAHSEQVIHRDIKPANILFRKDGSPVLVDFGIARNLESSTEITTAGTVMGTPLYMSPEQCRGEATDLRSDVYSLGALLFQLLEGELPFRGDNHATLALQHTTAPVPPLSPTNQRFSPVVNKALTKIPKDRFQSAAEFLDCLNSCLAEGNRAPSSRETTGAKTVRRVTPAKVTAEKRPARHRVPVWILGAVAAAAIAAGMIVLNQRPVTEGEAGRTTGAETIPGSGEAIPASVTTPIEQERETTTELLRRAKVHVWNNQMFEPAGDNALDLVERVLEQEPEQPDAVELKARLINTLATEISSADERGDRQFVKQGLRRLRDSGAADIAENIERQLQ
ncbi:serine/threonine protein kinase [Parahaliea maris]|uniref:non-specific serine/threonine protein kinase n=1 Tax=Parahaliea maris TaxID=2716870 RepID=A0A5C9A791_9GAMM|nr:serine/threonine-protein kinase [Parahaliea maris]TXS96608.1 serine/threonine protein kinase [Parahaliea maris]